MKTNFISTSKQWQEAWWRNWASRELEGVRVAVAYCSPSGAIEIQRAQRIQNVPVQMLVGLNDGVTDVLAQERLATWACEYPEIEVRGHFQHQGRFHPKLYIFEKANEVRILIGSVNLTKSAFYENTEACLEWVCPKEQWPEVLEQFELWWSHAKTLERPGAIEIEMTRLGLESRLIATMKQGILVEIEAFLSPARGQFQSDVFNLGQAVRVQEGVLMVERLRQVQVLLIGQYTYGKLVQCRDEAHATCHALSFSCTAGHFVPVTALAQWKKEHYRIEREFADLLTPFYSAEGRAKEGEQLRRELPTVIARVWKSVHGTVEVPAENEKQIIEQAMEQFEAYAPRFPTSVHLNLSKAPHPFPAMLEYAQTDSVVESELHQFAEQNREEILRDWMAVLLGTTRQMITLTLDQLLGGKRKPATCAKLRETLCQQLGWFNFYGDQFCAEVRAELVSHTRTPETLKGLREVANADLLAVKQWPEKSFEEVLRDFAIRVGWI